MAITYAFELLPYQMLIERGLGLRRGMPFGINLSLIIDSFVSLAFTFGSFGEWLVLDELAEVCGSPCLLVCLITFFAFVFHGVRGLV